MNKIIEKSFKYRLYPIKEQEVLINKTLGCSMFVYNHFVYISRIAYQKEKLSINYNKISKMLTSMKKKPGKQWFKEVDSIALQQSLKNLQRAYGNFFKKLANNPTFKAKHKNKQSYRSELVVGKPKKDYSLSVNIAIFNNVIQLLKVGYILKVPL